MYLFWKNAYHALTFLQSDPLGQTFEIFSNPDDAFGSNKRGAHREVSVPSNRYFVGIKGTALNENKHAKLTMGSSICILGNGNANLATTEEINPNTCWSKYSFCIGLSNNMLYANNKKMPSHVPDYDQSLFVTAMFVIDKL